MRVVKNGVVLPTPFIDVSDEIGGGGERGLLSIAFAPDYAVSGLVYAFATQLNGTLVVWQFHAAPGADVADAGHHPVLSIPHSATNHNGGQLQFGPDGYLYIGIGDNAQLGATARTSTILLGKILRIVPHPGSGVHDPAGPAVRARCRARDLRLRLPQSVALLVRLADRRSADRRRRRQQLGGDRPAPGRPGARRELRLDVLRGHPPARAPAPLPAPSRRSTSTRTTPPTARSPAATSRATRRSPRSPAATSSPTTAARAPARSTCRSARRRTSACSARRGTSRASARTPTATSTSPRWTAASGASPERARPTSRPSPASRSRRTTPAVGANVHLDASGSTDPDGPIISYCGTSTATARRTARA